MTRAHRARRTRRWILDGSLLLLVLGLTALSVQAHLQSQDLATGRSLATFRDEVAPILAQTCSARDENGAYACHGRPWTEADQADQDAPRRPRREPRHLVPTGAASCASGCHQSFGGRRFAFALGPSGRIETDRQLLLAFEKARELSRLDGPAPFAKLLRMPLGAQAGGFGLYHPGGEVLESALDPRFRKLASWVALDNARPRPGAAAAPAPRSEAERVFHRDVLPVFARNGCLATACHIFNHSSFLPDPGMPVQDLETPIADRFTPEQVRFNRMTSKGMIQSLVHLTGDVEQSRILKKIIPIEAGGILHRGGNRQLLSGPKDPDYQAIKSWLTLEREEALAKVRVAGEPVEPAAVGRVRGVVFVRTPTDNHRRYLDVGRYLPGGDLFLLKVGPGETLETARGPAINLTARFHQGPADVREPDVRYDGRALVFAMRKGREQNLHIYEIALDQGLDYVVGSFRQLTHGPRSVNGIRIHYTDPTYVPDPLDRGAAGGGRNLGRADLVLASNLAGEVVQSVERGTVGEADGGDRETIVDYDRPERDDTFVGRRVYIVDGTNRGEWRTITGFQNRLFVQDPSARLSRIRVDRPFPRPIDDSTIYVIERERRTQPGFLPAYAVYGMKIAAPGDEQRIYDETLTRITWAHGQDLDLSVRSTGEVFYTSQRSVTDKRGRPIFHLASCRRHLDTRFSFPTHHGNRSQVLVYADNHEMPSGIDIHCGLDPDNLWEGGNLSVSDHQFGPGLEARNPHDYATGVFDRGGVQRTVGPDPTHARFIPEGQHPSHPRFMFKKLALFPTDGPRAVTRTGLSPGGIFRDPIPLPQGGLLVSHSPQPLDHLDPQARPDFDLYVLRGDPSLHPPGGKGTPRVRLVRLPAASARGLSDVQAAPIYVRLKPKINAAKRPRSEHLIRYPGQAPDRRPARFLERNFLLIDAILRDPSPVGKHASYADDPVTGAPTAPIDRVRAVRFVEVLPATPDLARPLDPRAIRNRDPESTWVSNGIHPAARMVGETRLHPDGSIHVALPSNTALLIQSLNGDGMALRQEARSFFFAPNEPFGVSPSRSETFQTCGACMGSLTGDPKDVFGPVNPFSGQAEVQALTRQGGKPRPLGLAARDRVAIDFRRDVQPILDRHCTACHRGPEPAAGLSLTGAPTRYYSDAYESLQQLQDPGSGWYGRKRYVAERDGLAIESYLIEKVYGKELKAPRPLDGDRPHPSPALREARGLPTRALTDRERRTLVLWIDLGATFRGPDVAGRIPNGAADAPPPAEAER